MKTNLPQMFNNDASLRQDFTLAVFIQFALTLHKKFGVIQIACEADVIRAVCYIVRLKKMGIAIAADQLNSVFVAALVVSCRSNRKEHYDYDAFSKITDLSAGRIEEMEVELRGLLGHQTELTAQEKMTASEHCNIFDI